MSYGDTAVGVLWPLSYLWPKTCGCLPVGLGVPAHSAPPPKLKLRPHTYQWLIHVDVWQKPIQYCKVIIPQLKKRSVLWLRNSAVKISSFFLRDVSNHKQIGFILLHASIPHMFNGMSGK